MTTRKTKATYRFGFADVRAWCATCAGIHNCYWVWIGMNTFMYSVILIQTIYTTNMQHIKTQTQRENSTERKRDEHEMGHSHCTHCSWIIVGIFNSSFTFFRTFDPLYLPRYHAFHVNFFYKIFIIFHI